MPLPVTQRPHGPFGVVLNANAGRVTPRLARAVQRIVPPEHLFITRSPEQARQVLRTCVEHEYRTVFAGGGDGTIIDAINTLDALRAEAGRIPSVGVLRLGTGNALARWLGAGRPLRDLATWVEGRPHRVLPVRMVQAEGSIFPFGGLGYDAAILDDYRHLEARCRATPLRHVFSGLAGYLLAAFGRTLPHHLGRPRPTVQVTNLGRPAWRIGRGGDELGDPIPTGGTIYRGTVGMIGGATTPQLGYGIRFFPFACRRPGRFHLRLVDMSPLEAAFHWPAAARGTLHHTSVHDFYVDRVRLRFSEALPFEVGGDPKGFRDELVLGLSEYPVSLVGQA